MLTAGQDWQAPRRRGEVLVGQGTPGMTVQGPGSTPDAPRGGVALLFLRMSPKMGEMTSPVPGCTEFAEKHSKTSHAFEF